MSVGIKIIRDAIVDRLSVRCRNRINPWRSIYVPVHVSLVKYLHLHNVSIKLNKSKKFDITVRYSTIIRNNGPNRTVTAMLRFG